jgi:hypothetical protein
MENFDTGVNFNKRYTALLTNTSSYKHDYPILEYQEKFKNNYLQMKSSLSGISGNITNYKHEIAKLEDFLIVINEHEKNYKSLTKKYTKLKKILEESIEIESLIGKLSSNQQIINISEYVNLHTKVKEIIKYFDDSNLNEKSDFEESMERLMWRGFKVYEETFYLILKRYDQLEITSSTENEKLNLLNKIRSLAECMQDESIKYDFTSKLIRDRREAILTKFTDLKIISKNTNEDNYEKNSGFITIILIESEKLFSIEKEYIYKILQTCSNDLKEMVYSNIIESPLEKIWQNLKDLLLRHTKTNVKRIDFYQNFDILNIWYEKTYSAYKTLVQKYNKDIFNNICSIIKMIESFCFKFIDDYIKDVMLLNEKIENENVLKICNDFIFFISNLVQFDIAYEFIKSEFEANGMKLEIEGLTVNLIKKLESKSSILEKKYPPLKYIFLINNVYFIQSKVYNKPINKYVSKTFADSLTNYINSYIQGYLNASWTKVLEITFNEKEGGVIQFESDGKTLKNSSKEIVKKKFATFNETMKINLKFQQQIQIIDVSLEKKLIEANIDFIVSRYASLYDRFCESGFTKFKNKYVLYSSANDVIQDLKFYFMPDTSKLNK